MNLRSVKRRSISSRRNRALPAHRTQRRAIRGPRHSSGSIEPGATIPFDSRSGTARACSDADQSSKRNRTSPRSFNLLYRVDRRLDRGR